MIFLGKQSQKIQENLDKLVINYFLPKLLVTYAMMFFISHSSLSQLWELGEPNDGNVRHVCSHMARWAPNRAGPHNAPTWSLVIVLEEGPSSLGFNRPMIYRGTHEVVFSWTEDGDMAYNHHQCLRRPMLSLLRRCTCCYNVDRASNSVHQSQLKSCE